MNKASTAIGIKINIVISYEVAKSSKRLHCLGKQHIIIMEKDRALSFQTWAIKSKPNASASFHPSIQN